VVDGEGATWRTAQLEARAVTAKSRDLMMATSTAEERSLSPFQRRRSCETGGETLAGWSQIGDGPQPCSRATWTSLSRWGEGLEVRRRHRLIMVRDWPGCAARVLHPPGPRSLFADALSLFWAAWCQTARLPCQLLRAGIGRLPAEAIEGRERPPSPPPSPPPSLESDRSPGEISARLPRYVLRIGPPYRDGVGPERKPSARKPLLAELECARDMQRRRGGSSSIVNWSQDEEEGVVPRRASELGGWHGV
jgi:hypothetical protein